MQGGFFMLAKRRLFGALLFMLTLLSSAACAKHADMSVVSVSSTILYRPFFVLRSSPSAAAASSCPAAAASASCAAALPSGWAAAPAPFISEAFIPSAGAAGALFPADGFDDAPDAFPEPFTVTFIVTDASVYWRMLPVAVMTAVPAPTPFTVSVPLE